MQTELVPWGAHNAATETLPHKLSSMMPDWFGSASVVMLVALIILEPLPFLISKISEHHRLFPPQTDVKQTVARRLVSGSFATLERAFQSSLFMGPLPYMWQAIGVGTFGSVFVVEWYWSLSVLFLSAAWIKIHVWLASDFVTWNSVRLTTNMILQSNLDGIDFSFATLAKDLSLEQVFGEVLNYSVALGFKQSVTVDDPFVPLNPKDQVAETAALHKEMFIRMGSLLESIRARQTLDLAVQRLPCTTKIVVLGLTFELKPRGHKKFRIMAIEEEQLKEIFQFRKRDGYDFEALLQDAMTSENPIEYINDRSGGRPLLRFTDSLFPVLHQKLDRFRVMIKMAEKWFTATPEGVVRRKSGVIGLTSIVLYYASS